MYADEQNYELFIYVNDESLILKDYIWHGLLNTMICPGSIVKLTYDKGN